MEMNPFTISGVRKASSRWNRWMANACLDPGAARVHGSRGTVLHRAQRGEWIPTDYETLPAHWERLQSRELLRKINCLFIFLMTLFSAEVMHLSTLAYFLDLFIKDFKYKLAWSTINVKRQIFKLTKSTDLEVLELYNIYKYLNFQ